jgi:hypothetical protein
VVPHLNLFFKNKIKTQKVVGTTLPHRQCGEKLYIWVALNHYSYEMSNDSLPPKYTTFHHLVYVAMWSLTLISYIIIVFLFYIKMVRLELRFH